LVDADQPFYDDAAHSEPHSIYQGEILVDVPLFVMPFKTLGSRWLMLRTRSNQPVHDALTGGKTPRTLEVLDSNKSDIAWEAATHVGDYVIGALAKRPALVLSQNCDIENKQFIQVAPIYPSDDENYIGKLIRGEIISAFRMPRHPPEWTTESYADFEHVQAVHKSYRKRIPGHFRLSPPNILKLQQALTRYFGRPNSFDAGKDPAPISAKYLCTQCFYRDGLATSVKLSRGDSFAACTVCGGVGWVVQLGSIGTR